MAKTQPFDDNIDRYEDWFVKNKFIYLSELEALKKVIPTNKKGIEIGIGSGLFAKPLGIQFGIEASEKMMKKAIERGLKVTKGIAEDLPIKDNEFDFALMVTTICFVDDLKKSFLEVRRVLKSQGKIILGFVDKESQIGKLYQKNKDKSVFYKDANFYSAQEIIELLTNLQFTVKDIYQTVFGLNNEIKEIQKPISGYGKGGFVVICARKNIYSEV